MQLCYMHWKLKVLIHTFLETAVSITYADNKDTTQELIHWPKMNFLIPSVTLIAPDD